MPFSGARSFMRRRLTRDLGGVDYAIMGIPFDLSTSGRSGARFGPDALRRATSQVSWGAVWPRNFDPFDRLSAVDYRDVFYQRGQTADMLDRAYRQALDVLGAGTKLITLGGDHLVTYPVLKAHAQIHGPLALIQFDAHRDTARSSFLDHGSFVRFAMDEGLIDPARSIQIGIRTQYDLDDPITVLHRPWLRKNRVEALVEAIERVTDGTVLRSMYNGAMLAFDEIRAFPDYPSAITPIVADPAGSFEHYANLSLDLLSKHGVRHVAGVNDRGIGTPHFFHAPLKRVLIPRKITAAEITTSGTPAIMPNLIPL